MTEGALGLLLFTIVVLLIQAAVMLRFLLAMRAPAPSLAAGSRLPKAAVVMAARGADPFLLQALQGLLAQDYSDFEIHIVVDSDQDLAWQAIDAARRADDRGLIHVDVLRKPAATCSLKNSALIQAVGSLEDAVQIVAFLDGDVVPHPSWLRELATPLLDAHVGVVTGNRWFEPREARLGSLVRYLWNVAAVVQMWLNGMVWAGSMALRRDVLCESGLLDVWRRSMSTDSVVFTHVRKHGLRVEFAADVIMFNCEEIRLPECVRWMSRQLFMNRLYHPRWFMVVLQAVLIALLQLGGLLLLGAALLGGQWSAAGIAATAVVSYWAASLLFARLVDGALRRRRGARDAAGAVWRPSCAGKLAAAMVATNLAFVAAMGIAMTSRRVVWRGINYKVNGPFQIERGPYVPYRSLGAHSPGASIV
jgi:cellulose synthase/poly-beta-1,6-N-acetylglucosamine synthase-like glycosyltransferase